MNGPRLSAPEAALAGLSTDASPAVAATASRDVVGSYLFRLANDLGDLEVETARRGVWIVRSAGIALVISVAGSVVVWRVKVLALPPQGREAIYQQLLTWNATEVVHGAYGLEGDNVVLTDALQLENLDFNEFQATFDDLTMAIANHMPCLTELMRAA